jgi:hypothetical protein
MNYYLTAIDGMTKLLEPADQAVASFERRLYADAFLAMYQRHAETFDALEQGYQIVIDKDQYLTNMAEALAQEAFRRVEGCKKRGEKERMLTDLNLEMVAYVFPMILRYDGESSRPLADKVTEAWKKVFPKTNIHAAPFEEINEGFHRKFCYITTAACEVLGKPDDCRELMMMREYRDTYLSSRPDGEVLVQRYYDVAPSIVKHINSRPGAEAVYRGIWETYLMPCIHMIEAGELEECRVLYEKMVDTLEDEYFLRS